MKKLISRRAICISTAVLNRIQFENHGFWAWIGGGRSHLRHFPRIRLVSCYGLIVDAGVKHPMTCGGWR
jgi:hypothetical protein